MQAFVSLAGFPKLLYKHIQSLQVQSMQHHIWCHGHSHGHPAVFSVAVATIRLYMVSQVLSLGYVGVGAAIITLCMIL
jgi:hypothetical protein